jgi:hypothetical protein
VARRKTTYGKLERDREKQAKQKAKLERRAQRAAESASAADEPEEDVEAPEPVDEEKVLAALAKLQASFGAGEISFEEFEERRDELSRSLGMGG